jgi:hypothetical protein
MRRFGELTPASRMSVIALHKNRQKFMVWETRAVNNKPVLNPSVFRTVLDCRNDCWLYSPSIFQADRVMK